MYVCFRNTFIRLLCYIEHLDTVRDISAKFGMFAQTPEKSRIFALNYDLLNFTAVLLYSDNTSYRRRRLT